MCSLLHSAKNLPILGNRLLPQYGALYLTPPGDLTHAIVSNDSNPITLTSQCCIHLRWSLLFMEDSHLFKDWRMLRRRWVWMAALPTLLLFCLIFQLIFVHGMGYNLFKEWLMPDRRWVWMAALPTLPLSLQPLCRNLQVA